MKQARESKTESPQIWTTEFQQRCQGNLWEKKISTNNAWPTKYLNDKKWILSLPHMVHKKLTQDWL